MAALYLPRPQTRGCNSQVSGDDLLHEGKSGQFVLTNHRKLWPLPIHSDQAAGAQKTFQGFLNQANRPVIDTYRDLNWEGDMAWI